MEGAYYRSRSKKFQNKKMRTRNPTVTDTEDLLQNSLLNCGNTTQGAQIKGGILDRVK